MTLCNRSVCLRVLSALSILVAWAPGAHAGELLHLKTGTLPLMDSPRHHIHGMDAQTRHFIVQYVSAITEEDKAFLHGLAVDTVRYIPDDALLVRTTEDMAALIKTASSRVRALSRFAAEWKISPEFWSDPTQSIARSTTEAAPEERILVSALSDTAVASVVRTLEHIPGLRVEWTGERDVLVVGAKTRLQDIAAIDDVEWIERAPVMIHHTLPLDSGSAEPPAGVTGYESGTKLMGFDAAWERGYRGNGQMGAVADTGLDSGNAATLHADFSESFYKGYLAGLGTETWGDSMGHGTHVCGSVTGSGRLLDGAFKGGAYASKLEIESIWSAIMDNLAPSTNVAKLIDPVYNDGARVHSNSWGNARNLGEYDTFAARMDEYMWKNPEMLILFAAGNSGQDMDRDGRIDEGSVGSPGTAKNVLTVGASENLLATGGIQKKMREMRDGDKKWGAEPIASSKLSDNPSGIAAFSSRGPTSDGRLKPEIVAPGTNIVSTRSHNPNASVLWGAYDDHYAYSGGTSMATPLTAGAALVVREYLVAARGQQRPSAALVKATLMHTAKDLFPGQFGEGDKRELTRRPNVHEGYGRVDMDTATRLGNETRIYDEKTGVGLGAEQTYAISVGAPGMLLATLVYTDAPASTSASRALVNDLDLKVTGPDGKVYGKQDRINNAEMLELSDLAPGNYTVSVSGVNVPQGVAGKQPYALVVTAP